MEGYLTRNHYLAFSEKLEIPNVYETEDKQSIYATYYRSGRIKADFGDDVSMKYLQMLREEALKGYLDGIRDELLFQEAQQMEKALE